VLLNLVILVISGLSEVLGALGQILLSYLVHMHSRMRSLRQGQVHVGLITWEVLPQLYSSRHKEARSIEVAWELKCWIWVTSFES
jgi:hypothetical protein